MIFLDDLCNRNDFRGDLVVLFGKNDCCELLVQGLLGGQGSLFTRALEETLVQ